jgi:hypothetical protein
VNRLGIVGLLKMELPGSIVARLCDGAFFEDWETPGQFFRASHDTFGTIASVEAVTEGIGAEVPALELSLNPHPDAEPGDLSQPGFQQSIVRFWIGEYHPDTHLLIGTPELVFHGQIDQTGLSVRKGGRELSMTIVSTAERLFIRNRGNSLNPRWHKSVWPGETGHDNAIGLSTPVAWGVEAPQGGSTRGGGGIFGNLSGGSSGGLFGYGKTWGEIAQ